MGNVLTYLKWRGDLSLKERSFNEVDNLILSSISYFDFEGIVPSPEENRFVTVSEAWRLMSERLSNPSFQRSRRLDIIDEGLLAAMAASERFKHAKLSCFVEHTDEVEVAQFAALLIELGDDAYYVSYRGTDNSILGWREDFSLSFQTAAAQQQALDYLEAVVCPDRLYRVGGHSKGGNLAMYASMMCSETAGSRILNVYNNDGPGFCRDLPCAEYLGRIQNKLIRIVPEFSVIGMLFAPPDSTLKIIGSRVEGPMQHLPLTWEVEGSTFVSKNGLTKRCIFINGMIDSWIQNVDLEHRMTFTRDFFDALSVGGTKLIIDVAGKGIDGFESILIALRNSDSKTKKTISGLVHSVTTGLKQMDWIDALKSTALAKSIIFVLTGLFFMQLPSVTYKVFGVLFLLAVLIFFGIKTYKNLKRYNTKTALGKSITVLQLTTALVALLLMVSGKTFAFTVSTNFLIGVGFLFHAYLSFAVYVKSEQASRKRLFPLVNAVLCGLFGLVCWVNMYHEEVQYIFYVGIYLVLAGMIEVTLIVRDYIRKTRHMPD